LTTVDNEPADTAAPDAPQIVVDLPVVVDPPVVVNPPAAEQQEAVQPPLDAPPVVADLPPVEQVEPAPAAVEAPPVVQPDPVPAAAAVTPSGIAPPTDLTAVPPLVVADAVATTVTELKRDVDVPSFLPTRVKNVFAAVTGLSAATIATLSTFNVGHWSTSQTTIVTMPTGSIIGFIAAVTAHFWSGTAKEPVALAATFTAVVSATLALGQAFTWWVLTANQVAVVGSLVTALVGVGTALLARQHVTAATTSEHHVTPVRRT